MITRKILCCLVAGIVYGCHIASAADYSVSGSIIDSTDSAPCVGATYKIFLSSDTVTPAVINVTDFDGNFNQSLDQPGDYIFSTEYIGLKPYIKTFTVSKQTPSVSLGQISLLPDNEMLQEVVVTAKKKLVQSDGATLTYNVEDDPEASVNTTIEMLRKVPMVTIDAEDNIKVNGNSNFKILMNGKEDPMLTGDVKTILKSMPAATIKKIEVITEPGAKYDAEGTGGILNIVTVGKQSLEGYMANLSFRIGNNNYGGSAYGRMKINKVTASANFNYISDIDQGYTNSSKSVRENYNDDAEKYLTTENKMKNRFRYWGANLNLSWEPDSLNLFTLQGNVGRNSFTQFNNQKIYMDNADLTTQWSISRETVSKYPGFWLGANASYQHTFGKPGHHLILSYIFGYGNNDNDQTTATFDEINYREEYPYRLLQSFGYTRRNTAQIDYSNPINEKHLIEAGAKGNWQRNTSDQMPWNGDSESNLSPFYQNQIKVTQFQDILALYLSYTGNFGKWNTRAGVRYEHTRMGLDYKVGNYPDFTTNLNDVVPNVALSYRLTDASNLRLAYQMRISRPEVSQLNPYRNTMNVNTVSYGDPNLDSEHSNSLSLTYSNYGGKIGGSFSLNYERIDNMIENYYFMQDNIVYITEANIGHQQTTGANLNLQWTVIPMLNVGIYLSGNYIDIKANTPEMKASNSGWVGNYNINADYSFPFRLRLSAYGGGGSGWLNLQYKGSGYYYYGLSLSRSFFKNDLMTLTAYGQSFFTPYRTMHTTTLTDSFSNVTDYRFRQWGAGLSISFKLGGLKSDVKRTGANLEMIEGSSSSGNQQNGGM